MSPSRDVTVMSPRPHPCVCPRGRRQGVAVMSPVGVAVMGPVGVAKTSPVGVAGGGGGLWGLYGAVRGAGGGAAALR